MEKHDLQIAHACGKHIEDHAKTVQTLMESRFNNTPVNERLWRHHLENAIKEIEKDVIYLKAAKTIIYTSLEN